MLTLNYLIFKNNYVVPNFNYGMLCYMTNFTSAGYVFMIEFMEKNYYYYYSSKSRKILFLEVLNKPLPFIS